MTSLIKVFLVICLFIIAIGIIASIIDHFVETIYRGTKSERKLLKKLLKCGISADCIFHDLYIERGRGYFSQIDLVALTRAGMIVFEVKDYSGWIFGRGDQRQWTQVLAYGKEKHRFYNPIMQNNGHISALMQKLKIFKINTFFSVIVFYGNCELKDVSSIPKNTFIIYPKDVEQVIKTIIEEHEPVYYYDKSKIIGKLKDAVLNGANKEIRKQHIKNIRDTWGDEA